MGVNESWEKIPAEEVEGKGQAVERGVRREKRKTADGECDRGDAQSAQAQPAAAGVRRSARHKGGQGA